MVMDTPMVEESFGELFGQSVSVGLTNILGKSGAEATLKKIGLGPFPGDPDGFDAGLVAIFQRAGARAIERQILKVLFNMMSERFLDESKEDFAGQVQEMRLRFAATGGGGEKP